MIALGTECDLAVHALHSAAELLHEFEARRAGIVPESKAQGELVTAADRALNALLVRAIHDAFPSDAICAEEGCPWDDHAAFRRWFIDPIDGTRSFVAGQPGYAIMLALAVQGVPRLGAIYDPASRTTIVAQSGGGVHEFSGAASRELTRGRPAMRLAWSPYSRLEAAAPLAVAIGLREIAMWESVGMRAVALARGEAVAFASCPGSPKLWDTAAARVIVDELGGRYTDFDLHELDYSDRDSTHRRGAVASLGLDHVDVVAAARKLLGAPK